MRLSLWSNLRTLALALVLGFSYPGEVIAHGLAHRRELDHHTEHHSRPGTDGLSLAEVTELEVPDVGHTDQTFKFGEGIRIRISMPQAAVSWELKLIVRTDDPVLSASPTDVKNHPQRGPPPRLRAPPTA